MDKRLYDAAVQGDTASLYQLLEEDPDAIDKSYIICEDMNVLHISAMLGHEEFVKAILQINSPSSHRMCLARDREGKNPLQVAAINGKLEILNLVHHHDGLMQAAFEKAEEGGTILHLCVKYNQLEALKLLLQILTDPKLVGAKNKDGMTILHMAFEFNQNQRRQDIIIYLIENAAGIINLRNADGKTALDLFLEQAGIPSHDSIIFGRNKKLLLKLEGEGGIKDALSRSKAEIGEDAAISGPEYVAQFLNSVEKSKDAIIVVASIIATMAFQAMVSPPGGVWQDDSLEGPNPHRAGESVLAQTQPKYYKRLIWCNTVAFVSSLVTIMMHVAAGLSKRSMIQMTILFTAITVSVTTISAAYAMSLGTIVPESTRGSLGANTLAFIFILAVMFLPMILPISVLVEDAGRSHVSTLSFQMQERLRKIEAERRLSLGDQSI